MAFILCVTGKMAAGKNYVSSLLEENGFSSVDADVLVHKAIEKATPKILDEFSEPAEKLGINLQNPDGTLNRRELGRLLFSDEKLLKKQEEIVYPEVIKLTREFVENVPPSQKSEKRIIINATVLYKTPEIMKMCDKILFVDAPFLVRLLRAKKRDKMKVSQIIGRFRAQKNLLSEYEKTGIPIIKVKNLSKKRTKSFIKALLECLQS